MTKLEKQIQELEEWAKSDYDFSNFIGDPQVIGNVMLAHLRKAVSIINQLKEDADFNCKEYHRLRKELQAENLELREVVKKEMSISNDLKTRLAMLTDDLELKVQELQTKNKELQNKLAEMTKCRDNALEKPMKLAREIVELNEENQQLFNKNKELEAKLKELNNDK